MENPNLLKQNPLLKLVLPFVLGIAVGWFSNVEVLHVVVLFAVSFISLLLGLSRFCPKWLFGIGAVLTMFAAGAFVEHCQSVRMEPRWSSDKLFYKAHLVEVPSVHGTNVKVLADVVAGDGPCDVRNEGLVYLYFQRTINSEALEIGDSLLFETVIEPPVNAGNPAEFDVESYYYLKGITGNAFLYDDDWQFCGSSCNSLSLRALSIREKVVGWYESWGFSGDGLALLSALTVGEKRDLTQELKENYSSAGVSHVLALSGLHLGIIYALVSLLWPQRRNKRILVLLREAVVLALLWGFAFISGLSPSVVRAAILFSLVSVARCIDRDSSSLSSLSFAAIVMLLFSPHLLFDIGFQLSFSAVLSIFLFAEPLQILFKVDKHGKVYGYLVNLIILTLVAQVGTLPFVWYHFGEFPVYSFLSNMIVVPLAFIVIAIALLTLIFSFVPFLHQLLVAVLYFVVDAMNGVASFVSELPGASMTLPPVGVMGAIFVAVMAFLLFYALLRRRWWLVALVVVCSTVTALLSAVSSEEDTGSGNRIVIYNNRKNPLLHAVEENGENWLVSTVPQLDAEYEYVSLPYIKREGLPSPQWACWNYAGEKLSVEEGLLGFCGLKVRLVDNGYWNESIYSTPADVVVLCRGFLGSIEELLEVYPTNCLILDASLYKRSRERILRECAAIGIEPVDISRSGAVAIIPGDGCFTLEPLRGK